MKLFLLDIDNTLLIPRNIHIYYDDGIVRRKYTPEEYAEINVNEENKKFFDYSDFKNPEVVQKSILTSTPLYDNLKFIRNMILDGWNIGILTARGEQEILKPLMKKWLDEKLDIETPFIVSEVYGVNDARFNYPGCSDADKKMNVIEKINQSEKYSQIAMIDDSIFIIKLLEEYNKTVPPNKQIITFYAK
jgi:hypothetical protein